MSKTKPAPKPPTARIVERLLERGSEARSAALHAQSSHEANLVIAQVVERSDTLDRLLIRDGLTVLCAAIRDAEAGQPGAQNYDAPSVSGTPGRRDPLVYDAGTGHLRADPARRHEADFLSHLRALVRAVDGLERLATTYEGRGATAEERRATERTNAKPCEHCATITDPRTGAAWRVDTEIGMEGGTTVGGRLAVRMRLCGADRKHVERYGVLPESEALTNRQRKALKGAA